MLIISRRPHKLLSPSTSSLYYLDNYAKYATTPIIGLAEFLNLASFT